MKVIIAVGARQFDEDIRKIFQEAGIEVYSQTNVSGHNEGEQEELRGNWFALSSDEQRSIVFFSFTDETKAAAVLQLANDFNASLESSSRIRAFIMNVEQHN